MSVSFFDKILTTLRGLCGGKGESAAPPAPQEPLKPLPGYQGPLDAPALLLSEDDRVILTVDYFFADIPSWLEWDGATGKLAVVQMGGAVAELGLNIPDSHIINLEQARRVYLITRMAQDAANDSKIVHAVSLIVRR